MHTSSVDWRWHRTSSGAFLTSSISSGLVGNTIHVRSVAILNNPGLVLKPQRDQLGLGVIIQTRLLSHSLP